MVEPLVSCILATKDRRLFLRQAIKYFLKQTYPNKELVIVDDSSESMIDLVPKDNSIKYMKLNTQTTLGAKLNLGIEASRGQIIQKLDDDDYYHPQFLTTTVTTLLKHDPECAIVGSDCFLVLITDTRELKFSGHGWCAGGTLCFFRLLWEKNPFRNVPRAVDWWFLKDHIPQRIKIRNPELYILVRHDMNHLWKTIGKLGVTGYFCRRLNYTKSLEDLLSTEDLAFYEGLRKIP